MLLCYYRKNKQEHWTKILTQLSFASPIILVVEALVYSSAEWGVDILHQRITSAIKLYVYVSFLYFINEETTNRDESFVQNYTASKYQCQHLKNCLFHNSLPF